MDRRMQDSLDRWLTTPPEERYPLDEEDGIEFSDEEVDEQPTYVCPECRFETYPGDEVLHEHGCRVGGAPTLARIYVYDTPSSEVPERWFTQRIEDWEMLVWADPNDWEQYRTDRIELPFRDGSRYVVVRHDGRGSVPPGADVPGIAEDDPRFTRTDEQRSI